MAIKPKDIKFEEAALRKRLEFVRNLKEALQQEDTLVAQTVNAYTNLIDGEHGSASLIPAVNSTVTEKC